MIIQIEQPKHKKFKIKINNKLKYFSNIKSIPGMTNYRKREGSITNIDGNIHYTLLPSNEFSCSGKIRKKHCIFNNLNQYCGSFYVLFSGFLNFKYIIEYENYKLNCYSISLGKTQHVSIYDGENQIAEIVKSIESISDYYIFLLDEYTNLHAILSLFVSFWELDNSSSDDNSGVIGYSYSYDKNNKFYNKNWITNNFNKEDIASIYEQIQIERTTTINNIKTNGKYLILFFSFLFILLIIWGILFYVYFR